jgi:hypothetical protein
MERYGNLLWAEKPASQSASSLVKNRKMADPPVRSLRMSEVLAAKMDAAAPLPDVSPRRLGMPSPMAIHLKGQHLL